MNKALVFSIEEFSTFDGPGIRTTVFLKGCPLRCSWCHNPEGQDFDNQIIKAQSGCIGCGACLAAGGGKLDNQSIRACPNRLLRFSGEEYTAQSLVSKLEPNFELLRLSGGGITFSGGEPLAHKKFLTECLSLLKGRIHTALQTSGYCEGEVFDKILPLADYFLFDLKLIDEDEHLRYTGVRNTSILRNFSRLAESGKEFTVRVPLIPTVTDRVENLMRIASLLQSVGVNRVELLPYNKGAGGKYPSVGRRFEPDFDPSVECQPNFQIFEEKGIKATLL